MPATMSTLFLLLSWEPFARTFGGKAHDGAYSVIQTTDESLALAGMTMSFGAGHKDMLILRLDTVWKLIWARTFGGAGADYAYSVIQAKDWGFAISGATTSFGAGNYDVLVLKVDSLGNILWARTIGGKGPDYANSVIQTQDGGFALAGGTASFGAGDADFFLIKLDSLGNLVWAKTFGDTSGNYAESVIQTADGGFVLAGWTWVSDSTRYDILIVRTDTAGNLLWARTFGGTDYARSMIQTADEGFAVAGTMNSTSGNCDAVVLRLDSLGNLAWARSIGGPCNDEAFCLIQSPDGSFVVAGDTESFGSGNWDCLVFSLDADGNLLWARTFGGKDTDWAYSVARTRDEGFVVGGWTKSFGAGADDFLLISLDQEGSCRDCIHECSPEVMTPELSASLTEVKVADCSPSMSEPFLTITKPDIVSKNPCTR
ncbi:MAG: hypothetical protein ABIN58_00295 [candidate division WOR-3 bacterium]